METTDSIIQFWFGDHDFNRDISEEKKSIWWSKNDQVDEEIRHRFEKVTSAVFCGEREAMQKSALGLLASIISLDQFPRNMYRGTAQSFSYDLVALKFANEMVEKGWDQVLLPVYRVFAYLPFEHSEEMMMQEKSLRLYDNLRNDVDEDERDIFDGYYQFACKHFEFIEQFGRYPHRNKILGRESTVEEGVFLNQPGNSF